MTKTLKWGIRGYHTRSDESIKDTWFYLELGEPGTLAEGYWWLYPVDRSIGVISLEFEQLRPSVARGDFSDSSEESQDEPEKPS